LYFATLSIRFIFRKPIRSSRPKKNSGPIVEGCSKLAKKRVGLHRFRIFDHFVYSLRYGAPRIRFGKDPPLDPWDPETKAFRHPVSATLTRFLDEASNQVAMVLVYTSWCPRCRKFLPVFGQFVKKYRDRVQFLLVIDGSANNFTEGYVPDRYPSIFFS
jgi:hypothetical protein